MPLSDLVVIPNSNFPRPEEITILFYALKLEIPTSYLTETFCPNTSNVLRGIDLKVLNSNKFLACLVSSLSSFSSSSSLLFLKDLSKTSDYIRENFSAN